MRSVCKWMIIAGSLIFYAPFGVRNLLVLLGSIAVNAALGAILAGNNSRNRRPLFILGIVLNVASLLFFKFSGTVLGEKIFFPIAISFYTFNQIAFLAETYKGEVAGFSLVDYLAYILFFPKIVQGPLMGYGDFLESLEKCFGREDDIQTSGNEQDDSSSDSVLDAGSRHFEIDTADVGSAVSSVDMSSDESSVDMSSGVSSADMSSGVSRAVMLDWEIVLRGLYLFSMGLFKKVIMADTFGKAVDVAYTNVAGLGSLEAIFVAVFYSFQLYFDFSGYCDMATGICMIMGFDLPLNFDSPYKAVNIVDFWKRWHITLTKFFTKYVYIPLGGNRRGAARMYLNFMVVFLVSGLWHGNGWNFIVWGAMHGVLFVITRAIGTKRQSFDKMVRGIKIILTFIYVTIAWVFFRAPSIGDAVTLLTKVFTGGIGPIDTRLSTAFQLDELWYVIKVTPIMKLPFAWDSCLWLFLIVGSIMIFFCKNAITIARNCKIGIRTTLLTVFLLVWSIVSFAGVSTFLYMNF